LRSHALDNHRGFSVVDRTDIVRIVVDFPEQDANPCDVTPRCVNVSLEETNMNQAESPVGSSIVAVYPDHPSAEHAVRQLHHEGLALADLSIVGRDFQTSEEPVGFVTAGDYATAGAKTGACFGGLFGLVVGAAFLVLPGIGPVVVAGPLAAAAVAGLEGALAGTALGGLAGALVGWGVPKDRALKYETQVKGGKFLVILRGNADVIARARAMLAADATDHVSVYKPTA
jgi:uncharacterized membrane protein